MQLTTQWYLRIVNILWCAECCCGKPTVQEGNKIHSKAAEYLLAMHTGFNNSKIYAIIHII